MKDKKGIKKDQVLYEYLRAEWLRLVGILPDLYKCILSQSGHFVKLFLLVIVVIMMLFTFNLNVVYAQTTSTWQNSATGLKTVSNTDKKTAGLTITINASATPSAYLQGGLKTQYSNIGGPVGIELGQIKLPGINNYSLISEIADWSHNEMTFSSNLKLWVSRLSPAILIQNQSNALRLFSGALGGATTNGTTVTNRVAAPVYPRYIAFNTANGIQVKSLSTSVDLSGIKDGWILVWYGSTSYFIDTKLPIGYSPYTGYGSTKYPQNQAYQADAPMLLKFENDPTSVQLSPEGGIDLTFAASSGYTSMMPLFGREHLKSSDTEGWGTIKTLPLTVTSKINFWVSRLCQYPITVAESYLYDSSTDTANISENIAFLPTCSSSSTKYSILSPMVALTIATPDQQNKLNPLGIKISGTLIDAGYSTDFGPIQGIENTNTYSYSVSGLKKYTDNQRIINTNNSSQVPAELLQQLNSQIDKITAAGHLAPWNFRDHVPVQNARGDIYFVNPADNLYHLTEIAQALSPNSAQQIKLINYIKSEKTAYPPETVYNLSQTVGVQRGPFSIDANTIKPNTNSWNNFYLFNYFYLLNKLPTYNFYGLAKYYELTNEPIASSSAVMVAAKTALDNDMKEQDWASLSWFKGFGVKHTAVENSNRLLTGLIGFVKVSKGAGDGQTESLGRSLLAKAAISRIAMAKYPRYLYSSGLNTLPTDPAWMPKFTAGSWWGYIYNYNFVGAYDDPLQVARLDQFGTYLYDHSGHMDPSGYYQLDWDYATSTHLSAYRDLVPESFRLLTDYAKQDTEIALKKMEILSPNWYAAFAEGILGIEHNLSHPIDSFQLFLAKAFIQSDTPQNLDKYIDIPWLNTGDFFYMQKLAETIKAYQGWAWSDTITGQPCTLSSASWSTTSTTQGSTVNLNVVGNNSCAGKQVNFEVRRNGTLLDDISANIQPQTASMSALLQASTTWVAERNPLIPFTDAQYYFKATPQGGAAIDTKPQLLTVTSLTGGTPTPTPTPVPTAPNDWPQVQKDPQHTGYSSETLGTNFKVAWTHPFQPDRVYPQVQTIIYQGKAIVGTEGANGQKPTVYALNATNGNQVWKFEVGGSILNSVAAYDNKIFFGSLDGAVYALNSSTGAQIWKNQLSVDRGFSTAPVVAENKVMLGGRDGNFYALDPNDGHVLWKYNVGSMILQTSAYNKTADNIGRVFFGAMDMSVYALKVSDGSLAWKTPKLAGVAFKDYWPVITQGKVIIVPMPDNPGDYGSLNGKPLSVPGSPFGWNGNNLPAFQTWLPQWSSTIATGGAALVPDLMNAQDQAMVKFQANPANYSKNLYILDETNGQEAPVTPYWNIQTMNGATVPPCVDKDKKLIIPVYFIMSGWGRLDLSKSRITDILYDGYDTKGQPFNLTSGVRAAGVGNPDETLSTTCTANQVLSFHTQEGNANFNGTFDQINRRWISIGAGYSNRQMSNNLQGGGANPVSVSNGMIYHISYHELIGRTTN